MPRYKENGGDALKRLHPSKATAGQGWVEALPPLSGRRRNYGVAALIDVNCSRVYACDMRAVEFTTELGNKPVVTIPKEVADKLPKSGRARIIVLTPDDPRTLCGGQVLMSSLCARIRQRMPFTTAIRRDGCVWRNLHLSNTAQIWSLEISRS